jgi:hypothetical protein
MNAATAKGNKVSETNFAGIFNQYIWIYLQPFFWGSFDLL